MTDANLQRVTGEEKRETKLDVKRKEEKKQEKTRRRVYISFRPREAVHSNRRPVHSAGGYLISGGRHRGLLNRVWSPYLAKKTPNTKGEALDESVKRR
jgi:hypothetical protein